MAYLGLNRETLDSPLEWSVCLPKEDCLLIKKKSEARCLHRKEAI